MPALFKLTPFIAILIAVLASSDPTTATAIQLQDKETSSKDVQETVMVANPAAIIDPSAAADFPSTSSGVGGSGLQLPQQALKPQIPTTHPSLKPWLVEQPVAPVPLSQPTTLPFKPRTGIARNPLLKKPADPIPETTNTAPDASAFTERHPILRYLARVLFNKKDNSDAQDREEKLNKGDAHWGLNAPTMNPSATQQHGMPNANMDEKDLDSDLDRALSNIFDI